MFPKEALTIIIILSIFSRTKAVRYQVYREWFYKDDVQFNFGGNTTEDEQSYLYTVITEDPDPPASTFNCKVTVETKSENGKQEKSCDLKFDRGLQFHSVKMLQPIPVGDDKVIIDFTCFHLDERREVFTKKEVINLAMGSCVSKRLSFVTLNTTLDRFSSTNLVLYKNKFDVIVRDPSVCHSEHTCRVAYYYNNSRASDPQFFQTSFPHAITLPVVPHSPRLGFFHVYAGNASFNATLVGPKGAQTYLGELEGTRRKVMSVVNEKLGLCVAYAKRARCIQFNADGNKILDATFDFKDRIVAMHNLEDGDILLLTEEVCKEESISAIMQATRLKANGRIGKQFDAVNHPYLCEPGTFDSLSTTTEDDEEVCFLLTCRYTKDWPDYPAGHHSYSYSRSCIPKSVL